MTQWHEKSKRKLSGGILHTVDRKDKTLSQLGGNFASTTIGETKSSVIKKRGSTTKVKLRVGKTATVFKEKSSKAEKGEILEVVENSANRLFTRRNVITKGAILSIKLSDSNIYARVTSRPGKSGVIQATEIKGYVEPKEEKLKLKAEKKKQREELKKEEDKKKELKEKATEKKPSKSTSKHIKSKKTD